MLKALQENKSFQKFVSWLGLFGSVGTLVCCAIPSALVLLGLGATMASFLGAFPQLIWLSENKIYIFTFSFFMLGLSYFSQKFAETQSCPIDKKEDCESAKSWSKVIFWLSLILNVVGFSFAFILPYIL